MLHFAVNKRF